MSYIMVDIEADGPIPGDYSTGNAEALLAMRDTMGLQIRL